VDETEAKQDFIEQLARMAARLAGRDPDKLVRIEFAGDVAFEGAMWRYPDFLARANAAYDILVRYTLSPHQ
jgi:hypothetical protein